MNQRQHRFVDEYMIDYNATQAAIRAGYSHKTARQMGSENLSKPDIKEALNARRNELDEQYKHRIMGKYEVLARLSEIAHADLGDLDLSTVGALKKAKEQGKSHLIKKIKVASVSLGDEDDPLTTIVQVEMYSAHEALRDLGKYHSLFPDKIDLNLKAPIKAYIGISPDDWDKDDDASA